MVADSVSVYSEAGRADNGIAGRTADERDATSDGCVVAEDVAVVVVGGDAVGTLIASVCSTVGLFGWGLFGGHTTRKHIANA